VEVVVEVAGSVVVGPVVAVTSLVVSVVVGAVVVGGASVSLPGPSVEPVDELVSLSVAGVLVSSLQAVSEIALTSNTRLGRVPNCIAGHLTRVVRGDAMTPSS